MSTIKLDSKGNATCQITVKNVSGAVIDGCAALVSLPAATKGSPGAVERNWVKIDGPAERHFAVDREEVFSIKIAVAPQKKGEAVPAGNYGFRMDVINTARPDDSGDQSQALGFTVTAAPPPAKSKLPLILIIAAVVLIVGGLTTWLLLRNSGSSTKSTDTSNSAPIPTPAQNPTPAKSTPAPSANPWAGTWVNENQNTSTIRRIVITPEGSNFSVHAFRKCNPECDLGIQQGVMRSGNLVAEWRQGALVHILSLRLNGNNLVMGFTGIANGRTTATSETFRH